MQRLVKRGKRKGKAAETESEQVIRESSGKWTCDLVSLFI